MSSRRLFSWGKRDRGRAYKTSQELKGILPAAKVERGDKNPLHSYPEEVSL